MGLGWGRKRLRIKVGVGRVIDKGCIKGFYLFKSL